jgi:hypothetical protein
MAGNRVSNLTQDNFGNFKLGSRLVTIGSTGDALFFSLPFGQFTVRRIRLRNPSASVTAGALGVWTAASQGGTNVVANASLTNLSATLTYQESTLTAAANSTIFTSATTFYINVGTAVAGASLFVDFYGDVVTDQL